MAKATTRLTPETIKRLFIYEPGTGRLYWKERTPDLFEDDAQNTAEERCRQFNKKFAGKEAFSLARGYRKGSVLGRFTSAHHVIWCLETGAWPTSELDHRNGIRDDNRFSNLRLADRTMQMRNRATFKTNKTGLNGVYLDAKAGTYRALIGVNGKQVSLGSFPTAEAAHRARKQAERDYGYSDQHGRRGRAGQ